MGRLKAAHDYKAVATAGAGARRVCGSRGRFVEGDPPGEGTCCCQRRSLDGPPEGGPYLMRSMPLAVMTASLAGEVSRARKSRVAFDAVFDVTPAITM